VPSATAAAETPPSEPQRGSDGRDTRWAQHRVSRRAELVEAALRTVRRHGAGVGMDEIAAEAGTSKTVLYRHFGDRAGLYRAVVASVDRRIGRDLEQAMARSAGDARLAPSDELLHDPARVVLAAIDAYLALVERDPEVYRFVVAHPLLDKPIGDDPVTGLTARIGDELADLLARGLTASGRPPSSAGALAHGVVGLVRAAADHWLTTPDPLPRGELAAQLTTLVAGGLTAVLKTSEAP
jgi:AcrR family transcriptional regulator